MLSLKNCPLFHQCNVNVHILVKLCLGKRTFTRSHYLTLLKSIHKFILFFWMKFDHSNSQTLLYVIFLVICNIVRCI